MLLLVAGFVADAFSAYLNAQGKPNYLPFNLFVLIETVLLYYFFLKILLLKFAKTTIYFFIVSFVAIWIVFMRKLGTNDYVDAAVTFENISIIILSIFYFYEQITKTEPSLIYNQPRFWMVAAYLIYSAGTFFLFIYIDSLKKEDQEKYYDLNYFLSILKYILLTIAMCMKTELPTRKNFQLT